MGEVTDTLDGPMAADDPALDLLRRSLYWSQGAGQHEPRTTQHVRGKMLESIAHLRDDERRFIPYDEPNLSGRSNARRRVKRSLFRILRYMTFRYDRLLREQAQLGVALADRVIALEAEVAVLRERADPPEERR